MAFGHSKHSHLITHAGTFTQSSTDEYQEEKKPEYLKNYFGYEHCFFHCWDLFLIYHIKNYPPDINVVAPCLCWGCYLGTGFLWFPLMCSWNTVSAASLKHLPLATAWHFPATHYKSFKNPFFSPFISWLIFCVVDDCG